MAITTRAFGTTQDGQNVTMYTLTNHSGASVSMLDLGAIVTNILVPDKSGKLADVALGFDTLAHYEGGHGAMGDTIGRFANRIGGGCFTLDGTEYHLYQNDGENTLHGGKAGFQKKVWQATPVAGDTVDSVKFHYVSADMEENFPGNLTADVTISWDDDCNLTFHYQATTDKATVINMTNHTYFNLAGYDHGTVREANWERNFRSAARYARKYKHLLVPASYVDSDGVRLGVWISNLRAARKNRPDSYQVTPAHIKKLNSIGMVWDARDAKWGTAYQQAKTYYKAHGNLHAAANYKSDETGFCLGDWLRRMREWDTAHDPKLTPERRAMLDKIGMEWSE